MSSFWIRQGKSVDYGFDDSGYIPLCVCLCRFSYSYNREYDMNIIDRECFLSNLVCISTDLADSRARKVWRHQRGNQKPKIEGRNTIQWQKEKEQKDKQGSTKHYTEHKISSNTNSIKSRGRGVNSCAPERINIPLKECYVFIRLHLHQLFTFLNITILRVNDKLKPTNAEK